MLYLLNKCDRRSAIAKKIEKKADIWANSGTSDRETSKTAFLGQITERVSAKPRGFNDLVEIEFLIVLKTYRIATCMEMADDILIWLN